MIKILSNSQGVRLSHEVMVHLRNEGILNLGIRTELATHLAGRTGIGPKKTTANAAFHLWNWIAILVFIGSVYWSFTRSWWWFILGFIVMRLIWSANKKGNAENYIDAAMVDKEFYENVLRLDGWMYQIDERHEQSIRELSMQSESGKITA